METSSDDILHDFFPFFRVYRNGRTERHILTSRVPAGLDPIMGVESKDIVISADTNVSARLFIPKDRTPGKKLPILIHFHGGGFCTGSAFCPILKYCASRFVNASQIVAVSVDYRLAPENPLPIAYEDSWDSFKWVVAHAQANGPEPWINEYADFGRVFLGGDSSGANIAHSVGVRASVSGLQGINLVGLTLVHPYFGSDDDDIMSDMYEFLFPTSTGTWTNPYLNPEADPRLSKLAFDKVLVCVAERDLLRRRGIAYYTTLKNSGFGGKVELLETQGKGHMFHMLDSNEDNEAFYNQLSSFISDYYR